MAELGGNPLTQKYGPLVGWQWVVVIGGAGAAVYFIRRRNASTSSSSAGAGAIDPATGVPYAQEAGYGLGSGALDGIVGQAGPPGAPGAKGAPGKPGKPGARGPRGPRGPASPPDRTRPGRPKAQDVAAGEGFGAAVLKGQVPWPAGVPVPKGIRLNPTTRKVIQAPARAQSSTPTRTRVAAK